MKKQLIQYASAAILGLGLALAVTSAGSAASPIIAGAMTGPALPAASSAAPLIQKIDHFQYFEKPMKHDRRFDRRYRRQNQSGVYFNFGGRGSGFTFGAEPSYRYYEPQYDRREYRHDRREYRRSSASAHISWCYDRYRSYRQWDNTFQPNRGPRRQCMSPYY